MLKTKIKASSVANLTDARYFAAWEVEWLGFCLDEHAPEFIGVENIAAISDWVDGVKIIGELTCPESREVQKWKDNLNISSFQLGMFTDLNVLAHLAEKVEILQEVIVETPGQLNSLSSFFQNRKEFVDYFLLNFRKTRISWEQLSSHATSQLLQLTSQYPILIDIELNSEKVSAILENYNVQGFCVQGGTEEKVGYKSFDELDEVFEAIEVLV